jgi:trehalose/maltose hydrolase-like predicted phosphorylase
MLASRRVPVEAGSLLTNTPLGRAAASTFEALIFDWDGTAVPDRSADAAEVRTRIEALCAAGVPVFVVSGTHVGNVDGQLLARPAGPGRLHLCLNRGSEVFEVTGDGPVLVSQRAATTKEERALDGAAERTVAQLGACGLGARIVSQRLNRRKIDIIPEPAWADPPKARIAELLAAVTARLHRSGLANLGAVVALVADAARAAGLVDPRITSDVKHVEIGLTDKADSARWAAAWLAERGTTGGLVMVAGDEFGPIGGVAGSDSLMLVSELARATVVSVGVEPGGVPPGVAHIGGGPGRFVELLDAQLTRRGQRRVPSIDADPGWVVPLPGERGAQRTAEALGALSNGWAGIRAASEEGRRGSAPLFVVNGVYTDGPAQRLLAGPLWTGLEVHGGGPRARRLLDLHTGVLERSADDGVGLRTLRFVSAANPHALAMRAEAQASHLGAGATLAAPGDADGFDQDERDGVALAGTRAADGAGIVVAARDWQETTRGHRVVERLAAWSAIRPGAPPWEEAFHRLADLERVGFDQLLAEHRAAWARRWADAEVSIVGAVDDQLAARFAIFHLLSAAPDVGQAAVGARGLTGPAYGGHVFWDADVFVLPALAAIRPAAARAMLEYRIRRLPAARDAAAARGLAGARFPWESAGEGTDVTPRLARGPNGEPIPIRTGDHEEHITADVAWAADRYATWSGDRSFLGGDGRDLLVDTARYWASRVRRDEGGRAHVYGVMGPDEYHEVVDDNAYTNVMARWNLRRAADVADETGGDRDEAADWRAVAEGLVDGWDPTLGLYEQFAGYWNLEPLLMADVARPPVAADVLLGAERVAGSQLIKQADTLMLHHLVPGEVVSGSLGPCLAYYEARTAHGSSLSPAIHASLFARARQPERALELFRLAARLDLDNVTGTAAGGLHLATMGGVWQALAYGFCGLHASGNTLEVDPCLPGEWEELGLRFRFAGQPIGVRAEHDRVRLACTAPLQVRVAGGQPQRCEPPGHTFTIERSQP